MIWSINSDWTLIAVTLYAKIAALGLLIACHAGTRLLANGFAFGGVIIVVTSVFAFEKGLPGSSYGALEGVIFTGVGTNQNILAYTLVVALAGSLTIVARRGHWMVVVALANFGVLYGVYRAGSVTGFISTFCVIGVRIGVPSAAALFRRSRATGYALLAASSLGAYYLVDSVLGKDVSTLSERLPFWKATMHVWREDPILGFGWGTVWKHPWLPAPDSWVLAKIYDEAGLGLTHGHNNFVDVAPEIGLVGMLVALAMFVHALLRSAKFRKMAGERDKQATSFVVLSTVALLVFGITEPMLTIPLGWWTMCLLLSIPLLPQPHQTGPLPPDTSAAPAATKRSASA
jgi:O-antigen ligase